MNFPVLSFMKQRRLKVRLPVLVVATVFCCCAFPPHYPFGTATRYMDEPRELSHTEKQTFSRLAGLYGRYYGTVSFKGRNDISEGRLYFTCAYFRDQAGKCRLDSIAIDSSEITNRDFLTRVRKVLESGLTKRDEPCLPTLTYEVIFSRDIFHSIDSSLAKMYYFAVPLQEKMTIQIKPVNL